MKAPKISDLLEKINKGVQNPDFPNVPNIEYDLLLQHVRELYNELNVVKNDKGNTKQAEGNTTNLNKETIQPETLLIKRTLYSNENLLLNDIHERKPEKQKEDIAITKKEETKATRNEEATPVKPIAKTEHRVKSSSINETIQSSGSLNEKLKSSSGKEVHKKLSVKPLKDLIDLNKKFVLLNDLFKGNAEAFSTAVSHIDSLNDHDSAEAFIQSQLVSNYYWDESSQSARLFKKLVKQKFGLE